jgi:mono/diheme cytochrome c family protein
MRLTRTSRALGTLVFLLLLVAFTVALSSARTTRTAGQTGRAQRVARGGYLATICGCNDCHTPGALYGKPDFERRLSGSEMGWHGPWGVTYGRNLTPHRMTGIGTWSEKEIVAALRTGHRPDGSILLPPMPWQSYAQMSDADAYAIAAYLKSLRPIDHKVPDRLPPSDTLHGQFVEFPPPSAWDMPPEEPVR